MWVNQIFSLIAPIDVDVVDGVIEKKNVIQNIIVCDNYEIANQIARLQYGDTAYAVDTTHYPLSIGDIHNEGLFYDLDGIEVLRNLTADEEASLALNKAKELELHQTDVELDIDLRLSMLELGLA